MRRNHCSYCMGSTWFIYWSIFLRTFHQQLTIESPQFTHNSDKRRLGSPRWWIYYTVLYSTVYTIRNVQSHSIGHLEPGSWGYEYHSLRSTQFVGLLGSQRSIMTHIRQGLSSFSILSPLFFQSRPLEETLFGSIDHLWTDTAMRFTTWLYEYSPQIVIVLRWSP